jgi:hypothetical protein
MVNRLSDWYTENHRRALANWPITDQLTGRLPSDYDVFCKEIMLAVNAGVQSIWRY